MIDNRQSILICLHRDESSVKANAVKLISTIVKYLNLLVVTNCNPSISKSYSLNVIPTKLPLFKMAFSKRILKHNVMSCSTKECGLFQSKHPKTFILIDVESFRLTFVMNLYFNSWGAIIQSFNDAPDIIIEKKLCIKILLVTFFKRKLWKNCHYCVGIGRCLFFNLLLFILLFLFLFLFILSNFLDDSFRPSLYVD